MTRRKFIGRLIKAGSVIAVGIWWLTEKVVPRRFVRAGLHKKYPGPLRPLGDVGKMSKWSG